MDFKYEIAKALSESCDALSIDEFLQLLEVPPEWAQAEYALPCFQLAKVLRKAPPVIAQELAQGFQAPACVEKVIAEKGYLNFNLNREVLAQQVLGSVLDAGEHYGATQQGGGRAICIDYSSINIAKPFGIHHLPTTAIGHSLGRIFSHIGYRSIGMNFLGDWGTQFGKMITAYYKWGDKQEIERSGVYGLMQLYVRFHDEAEHDASLEDEGRNWNRRIEEGDPRAMELFQWFSKVTLQEVNAIYERLGVHFDDYNGESFFFNKVDPIIELLQQRNLLVESDGAQVVDLEEYDMPPCIIRRTDGATLYATRDLAAALWRKENYDFEKCLYVVAYQQTLHFRQWFKVAELMGWQWAGDLQHVPFGMVSMEDGSMSTRRGRVIWMQELLDKACEKVLEIIEEKSPDLPDKEKTAQQIGIGAVLFSALYNNRIKDSTFSWENALNFEGDSAPYVQYTHARCCSVLRRAEVGLEGELDYGELGGDAPQGVLKALADFPQAVQEAAARYEPFLVARSVVALAKAYNKFYFECRIIDGSEAQQRAKLALTRACAQVIRTGLYLLGIEAPERM